MALDYVKFQRGTPADYSILKTRGLIEGNTLYFIYENGASYGSLYLGNILIGTVGQEASVTNLKDLSDVMIENIGATDILVYSSDEKWKNASIQEIANLIAAEQGLGFVLDENVFHFQNVDSGSQTLKLLGFENAITGSSPMKGVDGKLAWSTNNIDVIAQQVTDLNTSLENIKKEVAQQITNANHLKYEIVDSLSAMTAVNTVYLLPKDSGEENNGYDEFMLINDSPERLGGWEVDLTNYATTTQLQEVSNSLNNLSNSIAETYVTKTTFDSSVGDLTKLINYDAENPTTLVEEINTLYNLFGSSSTIDKVGDLTKLLTYEEGKETTIVDELNNIYEHLVWQSITIE